MFEMKGLKVRGILITSSGIAIGNFLYDAYLSSSPTVDFVKPVFIFMFIFAVLFIVNNTLGKH
ncbi:hypothetical protein TUM4438_45500 [Shewanella sairae]|uniref:Uncharacterized protein n=2 Tax=Shewanella sairae TaxID=190310 RepID=A0ABQ4PS19_9GAMM|nr:hypothetical protein TUM4438_45500 [Shewanella sairae]